MADISDLVLGLFTFGIGWFGRLFWVRRGETKSHQRDKLRLVDEVKQLKKNMAESTRVILNVDNFDSLRGTTFIHFLPEEQKEKIRKIYSKIVNKNNLIDIHNRFIGTNTTLGTSGTRVMISDPERKLLTPIEIAIAVCRKEI